MYFIGVLILFIFAVFAVSGGGDASDDHDLDIG